MKTTPRLGLLLTVFLLSGTGCTVRESGANVDTGREVGPDQSGEESGETPLNVNPDEPLVVDLTRLIVSLDEAESENVRSARTAGPWSISVSVSLAPLRGKLTLGMTSATYVVTDRQYTGTDTFRIRVTKGDRFKEKTVRVWLVGRQSETPTNPSPDPTAAPEPDPTSPATPEPTAPPKSDPTATATSAPEPKPTSPVTPEPTAPPKPDPTATSAPEPDPTLPPTPAPTAPPKPDVTATPTPVVPPEPTQAPAVPPPPPPTLDPAPKPLQPFASSWEPFTVKQDSGMPWDQVIQNFSLHSVSQNLVMMGGRFAHGDTYIQNNFPYSIDLGSRTPSVGIEGAPPFSGSVYVSRGVEIDENRLFFWVTSSLAYLYDVNAKRWFPVSPVGHPTIDRVAPHLLWTGTEVLVWGGGTETGALYNPATNSWRPMNQGGAQSPATVFISTGTARQDMLAFVAGPKFYLVGGRIVKAQVVMPPFPQDGFVYDLNTATWSSLTDPLLLSVLLRSYPSKVRADGKTLFWGGNSRNAHGAWLVTENTGVLFDHQTGSYRKVSNHNAPSGNLAGVAMGHRFVLVPAATALSGFRGGIYDPESDTWQPLEGLQYLQGFAGGQAITTMKNKVFFWGGSRPVDAYSTVCGNWELQWSQQYLNSGFIFDADTGGWMEIPSLPGNLSPRTGASFTTYLNQIVLFGGYSRPGCPQYFNSGATLTINQHDLEEKFIQITAPRRAQIATYYSLLLRRQISDPELRYWMGLTSAMPSPQNNLAVLRPILGSPEYFNVHGGTNTGFVSNMYRDVFQREPDAQGLSYWTNELNSQRISRDQMVEAFLNSSENKH